MLFTKCDTACPLIVEDLRETAAQLEKQNPIKIQVSIFSFDSARETPDTLKAFVAKRKLPEQWQLFTSTEPSVAELAAALGIRYKRLASGDYIHSNVIFFLNSKGEIVTQKEGLKTPRANFLKKINESLP